MDKDLKAALEQLQNLNKMIEGELLREADERVLQATRDSEQAEILAQQEIADAELAEIEKQEQEEQAKIDAENNRLEQETAKTRHEEMLKSIGAVESKILSEQAVSQQVIDELTITNQKLTELVALENSGAEIGTANNQLGTMAVSGLIIAIGAFAVFKAGGFVVSKITQILW